MTSCHECGSEVAEIDVFCPFCGISLRPVEVDDGQSDASFDSTIIMPSPVSKSSKAEPLTEVPVSAPLPDPLAASESAGIELPNPKDIYNVPTPSALTELENTAGSLFEDLKTKSPQSLENSGPPSVPDVSVPVRNIEHGVPEISGVDAVDISGPENIEPEVTVSSADEENGEDSKDQKLTDPEADRDTLEQVELSDSVFDVVREDQAAIEATEPEVAPQAGESDEPSEPVDLSSSEQSASEPEIVKDDSPLADQEISKPLDEPVPGDRFSSPSMFDSVQIMQNPGSDLNDASRRTDNNFAESAESESAEVAGATSGSGPSAANARPQTTPNIGLVDTDGRKSAKLKPLEEGATLNSRYEIVRKIGGGGMGAVYLASDNNLGGVLRAVKEMVQSYIEDEQQEKAVLDFKRESMILSTLDHPSIPTIYDYFFDEQESRFYLVMKYISGGDLSARLRSAPEGKLDEMTVTEWAIQIADVLDYLHNHPSTIVYRDLKPSNIMIDGNSGRVMLIDFGIARSIGQKEEKGVTAVGTMGYAPPELFSGNVEPRSDIYSLGSTMFHLLTGADPQSNPLLIFDFQKNPRPRQINPQLSDQIERFLMKAVEYSAASRFNSAAEMRQYLEDHLDNLKKGNVTYGVKEIPASVSLSNQNVFCGFCGQKIVATDLFCAFCGAKQPIAQHGVHSEIYTPAPMTAKLFVIGTSDLDSPSFQLDKAENLIGRRDPMSNIFPEVDLSKFDPQTKISRRHAKIWREGGSFLLEDLGSSNGTIIFPVVSDSMRLLPHHPQALSSGDKIKLGDTTLHFVVG